MCEQTPIHYQNGDIVWVKLSGCWWPGEVVEFENLPDEIKEGFTSHKRKLPLVTVSFFQEDSYEFVKNLNNIYSYNCSKKDSFIKKGMDMHRAKNSFMEKFPADICTAEDKTGGNVNILTDPKYGPEKKVDYQAEIFGTPTTSRKTTPKAKGRPSLKAVKQKTPTSAIITHPRFLGTQNNHQVRVLLQNAPKATDEIKSQYRCQTCNFLTDRIEVIIMHNKSHLHRVYKPVTSTKKRNVPKKTNKRLACQIPRSKTNTIEEDIALLEQGISLTDFDDSDETEEEIVKPKRKQKAKSTEKRAKKPKKTEPVEEETVDIRVNLLAEWDDEEEDDKNTSADDTTADETMNSTTNETMLSTADTSIADASIAEETKKDIQSCFDFNEEEDELLTASAGRKIPRVIPDKRKSTEPTEDAIPPTAANDDNHAAQTAPETVEEPQDASTDPDWSSWNELLESTSVPKIPDVQNLLKCDQNFHKTKTIKFPDKSEACPEKSEVVTKLTNPKKRFVKSFADFEESLKLEREKAEQIKQSNASDTSDESKQNGVNKVLSENTPETKSVSEVLIVESESSVDENILELPGENNQQDNIPIELETPFETEKPESSKDSKSKGKKSKTIETVEVENTIVDDRTKQPKSKKLKDPENNKVDEIESHVEDSKSKFSDDMVETAEIWKSKGRKSKGSKPEVEQLEDEKVPEIVKPKGFKSKKSKASEDNKLKITEDDKIETSDVVVGDDEKLPEIEKSKSFKSKKSKASEDNKSKIADDKIETSDVVVVDDEKPKTSHGEKSNTDESWRTRSRRSRGDKFQPEQSVINEIEDKPIISKDKKSKATDSDMPKSSETIKSAEGKKSKPLKDNKVETVDAPKSIASIQETESSLIPHDDIAMRTRKQRRSGAEAIKDNKHDTSDMDKSSETNKVLPTESKKSKTPKDNKVETIDVPKSVASTQQSEPSVLLHDDIAMRTRKQRKSEPEAFKEDTSEVNQCEIIDNVDMPNESKPRISRSRKSKLTNDEKVEIANSDQTEILEVPNVEASHGTKARVFRGRKSKAAQSDNLEAIELEKLEDGSSKLPESDKIATVETDKVVAVAPEKVEAVVPEKVVDVVLEKVETVEAEKIEISTRLFRGRKSKASLGVNLKTFEIERIDTDKDKTVEADKVETDKSVAVAPEKIVDVVPEKVEAVETEKIEISTRLFRGRKSKTSLGVNLKTFEIEKIETSEALASKVSDTQKTDQTKMLEVETTPDVKPRVFRGRKSKDAQVHIVQTAEVETCVPETVKSEMPKAETARASRSRRSKALEDDKIDAVQLENIEILKDEQVKSKPSKVDTSDADKMETAKSEKASRGIKTDTFDDDKASKAGISRVSRSRRSKAFDVEESIETSKNVSAEIKSLDVEGNKYISDMETITTPTSETSKVSKAEESKKSSKVDTSDSEKIATAKSDKAPRGKKTEIFDDDKASKVGMSRVSRSRRSKAFDVDETIETSKNVSTEIKSLEVEGNKYITDMEEIITPTSETSKVSKQSKPSKAKKSNDKIDAVEDEMKTETSEVANVQICDVDTAATSNVDKFVPDMFKVSKSDKSKVYKGRKSRASDDNKYKLLDSDKLETPSVDISDVTSKSEISKASKGKISKEYEEVKTGKDEKVIASKGKILQAFEEAITGKDDIVSKSKISKALHESELEMSKLFDDSDVGKIETSKESKKSKGKTSKTFDEFIGETSKEEKNKTFEETIGESIKSSKVKEYKSYRSKISKTVSELQVEICREKSLEDKIHKQLEESAGGSIETLKHEKSKGKMFKTLDDLESEKVTKDGKSKGSKGKLTKTIDDLKDTNVDITKDEKSKGLKGKMSSKTFGELEVETCKEEDKILKAFDEIEDKTCKEKSLQDKIPKTFEESVGGSIETSNDQISKYDVSKIFDDSEGVKVEKSKGSKGKKAFSEIDSTKIETPKKKLKDKFFKDLFDVSVAEIIETSKDEKSKDKAFDDLEDKNVEILKDEKSKGSKGKISKPISEVEKVESFKKKVLKDELPEFVGENIETATCEKSKRSKRKMYEVFDEYARVETSKDKLKASKSKMSKLFGDLASKKLETSKDEKSVFSKAFDEPVSDAVETSKDEKSKGTKGTKSYAFDESQSAVVQTCQDEKSHKAIDKSERMKAKAFDESTSNFKDEKSKFAKGKMSKLFEKSENEKDETSKDVKSKVLKCKLQQTEAMKAETSNDDKSLASEDKISKTFDESEAVKVDTSITETFKSYKGKTSDESLDIKVDVSNTSKRVKPKMFEDNKVDVSEETIDKLESCNVEKVRTYKRQTLKGVKAKSTIPKDVIAEKIVEPEVVSSNTEDIVEEKPKKTEDSNIEASNIIKPSDVTATVRREGDRIEDKVISTGTEIKSKDTSSAEPKTPSRGSRRSSMRNSPRKSADDSPSVKRPKLEDDFDVKNNAGGEGNKKSKLDFEELPNMVVPSRSKARKHSKTDFEPQTDSKRSKLEVATNAEASDVSPKKLEVLQDAMKQPTKLVTKIKSQLANKLLLPEDTKRIVPESRSARKSESEVSRRKKKSEIARLRRLSLQTTEVAAKKLAIPEEEVFAGRAELNIAELVGNKDITIEPVEMRANVCEALNTLATVSELTFSAIDTETEMNIEKNLTVVSDVDLQRGQVEIANIPSGKEGAQKTTMASFSVDFTETDMNVPDLICNITAEEMGKRRSEVQGKVKDLVSSEVVCKDEEKAVRDGSMVKAVIGEVDAISAGDKVKICSLEDVVEMSITEAEIEMGIVPTEVELDITGTEVEMGITGTEFEMVSTEDEGNITATHTQTHEIGVTGVPITADEVEIVSMEGVATTGSEAKMISTENIVSRDVAPVSTECEPTTIYTESVVETSPIKFDDMATYGENRRVIQSPYGSLGSEETQSINIECEVPTSPRGRALKRNVFGNDNKPSPFKSEEVKTSNFESEVPTCPRARFIQDSSFLDSKDATTSQVESGVPTSRGRLFKRSETKSSPFKSEEVSHSQDHRGHLIKTSTLEKDIITSLLGSEELETSEVPISVIKSSHGSDIKVSSIESEVETCLVQTNIQASSTENTNLEIENAIIPTTYGNEGEMMTIDNNDMTTDKEIFTTTEEIMTSQNMIIGSEIMTTETEVLSNDSDIITTEGQFLLTEGEVMDMGVEGAIVENVSHDIPERAVSEVTPFVAESEIMQTIEYAEGEVPIPVESEEISISEDFIPITSESEILTNVNQTPEIGLQDEITTNTEVTTECDVETALSTETEVPTERVIMTMPAESVVKATEGALLAVTSENQIGAEMPIVSENEMKTTEGKFMTTENENLHEPPHNILEESNTVEMEMAKLTDTRFETTVVRQPDECTTSTRLLEILTEAKTAPRSSFRPKPVLQQIKPLGQKFEVISKDTITPKSKIMMRQPLPGTSKPRINVLSDKTIRPLTPSSSAVSVQKVSSKRTFEDFEDIDKFIIQKPIKKPALAEKLESVNVVKKFATRTKPTILGQTIIKPCGEVVQAKSQTSDDGNVFDIDSMPIVLSDQILTADNIDNMPFVLQDSQKPVQQIKKLPTQQPQMKLLNKSASSIPKESPLRAGLHQKVYTKTIKPTNKVIGTTGTGLFKHSPTIISQAGRHGKFVIVPAESNSPTGSKYTVGKRHIKKPATVIPASTTKVQNIVQEPTGNKIMIVTNNQGQQSRVLLTPAQQKMMGYQTSTQKKTLKTIVSSKDSPKAANIISQTIINPKGQITSTPTGSGLTTIKKPRIDPTRTRVMGQKLLYQGGLNKGSPGQSRTIIIKNPQGQTIRKLQGSDDALLEKQVAEQLEAINRATNAKTFKPVMKKVPQKKTVVDSTKIAMQQKTHVIKSPATLNKPVGSVPPLAPISPKKPEVVQQAPIKKQSPKTVVENKPVEAEKAAEGKKPHQLVIQDALGNQTTITEGQILALPSETVDGQPQSYMLVTLDESGNLTPLNNEALMSLDPNLNLGGDLSNMVLQIDQGSGVETTQTSEIAEKPVVTETSPIVEPVPEPEVVEPTTTASETETMQALSCSINNGETNQQLLITGDPVATHKFLESLTEGNAELANLLANAEGNILIHADGQQILINTDSDNQMLLTLNSDTASTTNESSGNPIFSSHTSKNQDILAAALADTDVFQPEQVMPAIKVQQSQLSPGYINVNNVLETNSMNSPIMTPLEVPSTNTKKIDDESDILQVPKNVDLPITITDPNIAQTVANQQAALMSADLHSNLDLPLTIQDVTAVTSAGMNSPSFGYTLEDMHKPFTGSISMPLLTTTDEDVVTTSASVTPVSETLPRDIIEHPPKTTKHTDEYLLTAGLSISNQMCTSLSEPPPDMFDDFGEQSFDMKRQQFKLNTSNSPSSDDSCEIPMQPEIISQSLSCSPKRSFEGDDATDGGSKKCKFD